MLTLLIAEIVSLASYERQTATLMTEHEKDSMEFFIANAPAAHPLLPGTGRFREARWARPGGGKSGGFRVIDYFLSGPGRVYMASVYKKSRKGNLSGEEKHLLA